MTQAWPEKSLTSPDGVILATAGRSPEQSFIVANIVGEARDALRGKPCRVAEGNLRVRIPRSPHYVYPDASIICGTVRLDPQDTQRKTILNPGVIIEVLSPSTEAYDRGDMFTQYREIDSLEEYILISQNRPNVESLLCQPDGACSILSFTGIEATAQIRCLSLRVPLKEIYAGIEFTPADGSQRSDLTDLTS